MFVVYQAELLKSGNLHHPIEGTIFAQKLSRLGSGSGRFLGWAQGREPGTNWDPERFGWGLSWVMEGSEKKYGKGVGVARVSGGLPKRYLKVPEVFGRELVVEL